MIRDPSDGSVKEINGAVKEINDLASKKALEAITGFSPVIDTSTSGLPITAKESYLARLEESRKWLEGYMRPTING